MSFNHQEFDFIVRQLRDNEYAISKDVKLFNEWNDGKLSTQACLEFFKQNNYIHDDILPITFVKWLNSLGYHNTRGN
mgnify:CR=1 FL=1